VGRLEVAAKVANPADRSTADEVELMVDTGATFTVLPSEVWEHLGRSTETTRRLRTADGRVLERGQGLAFVMVEGQSGTVPVVQGADGDIAVLGVTTMEILGLAFDPVQGKLVPSEHLYL